MKVQNESFKTIAQTKEKGKSGKAGKCLVLQSFFLKLLRSSWLKQHSQNSTRYTICKKRKLEVRPK